MKRGPKPRPSNGPSLEDDFVFYMRKEGACVYMPTGEIWSGDNVNLRFPPVIVGRNQTGSLIMIKPTRWLAQNRPVEQMTWAPGELQLIKNRLIVKAGWIDQPGVTVFNEYVGPTIVPGDPQKAQPWIDLVHKDYPNDADHIIKCFAHRRQRPHEKINHSLMLGGAPGIGKDTILAPVREAIGPWNCDEIAPKEMFDSSFNGYRKSVLLRISEAHDLGEVNRFQLYERTKVLGAAPPEALRVNEKNKPEYYIVNIVFAVITTNHKTDGLYLPADDRRTYVAWSDLKSEDFPAGYWNTLWKFYDEENGFAHVAAYLDTLDISDFNPKAPPLKTLAFWDIVAAGQTPEDAELADVLDQLAVKKFKVGKGVWERPFAVTLDNVLEKATELAPKDDHSEPKRNTFAYWLGDRKNRRLIPHRFEKCGYSPIRNEAAPEDGLWKIGLERKAIYGLSKLSPRQRQTAAAMVKDSGGKPLTDEIPDDDSE